MKPYLSLLTGLLVACLAAQTVGGQPTGSALRGVKAKVQFPVKPEIFIDQFQGAEGITFNAESRLFIGANNSIWIAEPDGSVKKIADVYRHLGQARIGRRDILACDFGPTNVFADGPNNDGIVWRITPAGKKTVVATGIADPNAVVVLRDGSLLVSDDGTDEIYRVKGKSVSIWSTEVPFPNGLTLSLDNRVLYVAQIFSNLKPIAFEDRIWAFKLANGRPVSPPTIVARTGGKGVDGLVTDEFGRIYIADNGAGKIQRFDPKSGEMVMIAEGMPGVASLVFGEGKFDREAIYATTTMRGGGKIWKVRVDARGARYNK
jgi:sugar lactone lactonase YvrE